MKIITINPVDLCAYYRHKFTIEQQQTELRSLQIQARSHQKTIIDTQRKLDSIITK